MVGERLQPNRGDSMNWVKPSTCSADVGCVEVAFMRNETVWLRDSKNPGSRPLVFFGNEWREFLAAVKAGEYDNNKDD
jgi:hypothetical protein